jgi:acetyl-CoA synthetase
LFLCFCCILSQSEGAAPAAVELIEGNDVSGILGIKSHWPSMVRTVYGDHNRFMNTCEYSIPG